MQHPSPWTARALVLLLVATASGCRLDSRDGTIVFQESGTEPRANLVRLAAIDPSPSGNRLDLEVVVNGWTQSDDVFAFNFGIVLNAFGPVEYVPGSALAGPALIEAGCQDPIVLASPQTTGLTVAVSKLGPCAGNAIGPGEQTIVRLGFRSVAPGSVTIALGDSGPNAPSALNSSAQRIDSVSFDLSPAAISGW